MGEHLQDGAGDGGERVDHAARRVDRRAGNRSRTGTCAALTPWRGAGDPAPPPPLREQRLPRAVPRLARFAAALRCFALGIFGGLGSAFYLVQNGLSIGAILGYVASQGAGENILVFIVGHGSLELGAIVLADTRRLSDAFFGLDYFETRNIPFVVGVNHFDGSYHYPIPEVREALSVPRGVPVVLCDSRSRESVKTVLLALLRHLYARATAAASAGASAG